MKRENSSMQSGKKSPQAILLLVFSLTTLLLAACGGSSTTAQAVSKAPANQQILVLPISGYNDVATFDPALATEYSAISVIDMTFTGLVQLDDHLVVRDELAASHSVSADGLTWTFKLRPHLKF